MQSGTEAVAIEFDVIALGEMVIDFSPIAVTDGVPRYEQHPGGAASNVAVAVSKLGGRSAFVGAVGADAFGSFLRHVLRAAGVDDRWVVEVGDKHTTLAFVHLDALGERTFTVVGFPGAESRLARDSIDDSLGARTKILHLGSAILFAEPSRSTALAAVEHAKGLGTVTSFDVNYRDALWSPEEARRLFADVVPFIDILKVSEEELTLLTGTDDLDHGTALLLDRGPRLVAVTLGAEGSYYATPAHRGRVSGYSARVVDTNGAGDAFLAAVLWRLTRDSVNLDDLSVEVLESAFDMGNAAGALTTESPGAMAAAPTLGLIHDFKRRARR